MKFNLTIKEMTLIGICVALMAIFSQLSIPLPFTSVPVTLQIFGIVILSIIVGGKISTISMIVFILLGSMGLPVFANFSGGFSIIIGPTGGYIIGFIFMAFLIGCVSFDQSKIILFIASYIGLSIDYIIGILQLKTITNLSLQSSLIAGLYPFILKDILTITIAIPIGLTIKGRVRYAITKSVTA